MASPQKENGFTAISNEIMDAFAKFRISGEARQMLDVIIRKTYGFNKKSDQISTSQFTQLTSLKPFIIHRARKRLLLANLIRVSKNANSQVLTYSFQKDYDKWIPLAKKITVSKNAHNYKQKCSLTVTNNDVYKRHKDIITKNNTTIVVRDYFYHTYLQTFGKAYIPSFGKDGKTVKELLVLIPEAELKTLIDRFFASKDRFIQDSDHSLGVFKSQINKLRQPNRAGSMKCLKEIIPECLTWKKEVV